MFVLSLTWPAATVISTGIAAVGVVLALATWQIFAIGRDETGRNRRTPE